MQSKGRYRLTVRQGPIPGKIYELAKDVTTIGRDVRSDVVVNDAEVSRSHVRLTAQGDGYLVEDLGSTNGAFINGQRLTGPKVLRPGERLGLGETVVMELEFVRDSQATVIGQAPATDEASAPPSQPVVTSPFPSSEARPAAEPGSAPGEPAKKSNRLWIGIAVGCGCLALLACAAVVAVAVFLMANPDLLPSPR